MLEHIVIQEVAYQSDLHKKSIQLRYEILRAPLGLQFTEEQLAEEVNQHHIVALYNKEIVGVVLLQVLNPTILKMRQFAVETTLQKMGIGKELVQFCEEFAIKNNYTMIELHARSSAVGFYLKQGYRITSEEFKEVGLPHYKMQIKLTK